MLGSANVSGQAYAFLAMTPVKPGERDALAGYLRGLREHGPSPLERLARTHFARFLIVPDFHNDPAYRQRAEEHLDLPYLIFSSNFDRDLDSYLDELAEQLAPEAPEIWGRCVGCPDPPTGTALKRYLKHNQIDTGIFFAAYGEATVDTVKAALRQREQLIDFAVGSQDLAAGPLQQAFVAELGGAG